MIIDKNYILKLANESHLELDSKEIEEVTKYLNSFQENFEKLKDTFGDLSKTEISNFPFKVYSDFKESDFSKDINDSVIKSSNIEDEYVQLKGVIDEK